MTSSPSPAGFGPYPGQPVAAQPLPPSPQPMSRTKFIAMVLAAVLGFSAVAIGSVFAANKFLGDKSSAASVLPANTIAVVNVDLSPSMQQKFGAWKFSQNVSDSTLHAVSAGNQDWRKRAWEFIDSQGAHPWSELNYDSDIAPWLGEKISFASVPVAGQPSTVAVVQASDEGKARESLDRARTNVGGKLGYAIVDKRVVLSDSQATVDAVVRDGENAALADQDAYKQVDTVGDPGVFSGWVDLGRVQQAMDAANKGGARMPSPMISPVPSLFGGGLSQLASMGAGGEQKMSGQLMLATRFENKAIEMVVRGAGLPQQWTTGTVNATTAVNLPGSTLVAYSAAGMDQQLAKLWPQLEKNYTMMTGFGSTLAVGGQVGASQQARTLAETVHQATGWVMPQDGQSLLGNQTTVAVAGGEPTDPERILSLMMSTNGVTPQVGVQVKTDGSRFRQLVESGYQHANARQPFSQSGAGIETSADTGVVATSPGYAQALMQGGSLADSAAFRAVLPDAGSANSVLYVDIDGLAAAYPSMFTDANAAAVARDLDSFGMSTRTEGANGFEAKLRLSVK